MSFTHQDFIAKVSEMRTAQKQYFKTRDSQWLQRSKKLKREVDDILAAIYTAATAPELPL